MTRSLLLTVLWVLAFGSMVNAVDESHLAKTVEVYYQARVAEDVQTFLDTQLMSNDAAVVRARLTTEAIWSNIGVADVDLKILHQALAEDGDHGLVHYQVNYQVVEKSTGDTFPVDEEKYVLLKNIDRYWKIKRVFSKQDIDVVPQALSQEDLAAWKFDVELIHQLLSDPQTLPSVVEKQTRKKMDSPPTDKIAQNLKKDVSSHGTTNKLMVSAFDFENGDLDGWEMTGDAFTFQPTLGDNTTARKRGQASNHQGRYWIGTFEKRPDEKSKAGAVQGDKPKGTLTSTPFTLCKEKVSFLIGGGCDVNSLRAEMVVDNQAVHQATGRCNETMQRVEWDVTPWQGQKATLRIVDESSGGWGHINFDDFGPVCIEREATPRIDPLVMPEPLPTPTVKIVGSVKGGGTIETLYMLTTEPTKQPINTIKTFSSDPEQIIAWFEYSGFAPGDILTGVWSDVGKQVKLREDPVVVMNKEGRNHFILRRPVNGWSSGHYLVEIKKGKKVLRKAEFQIIE